MVASIIREIGTPAMKDRILDGAMNGDITIALGFTEPECGSDVAAAATRAVRDGDEWVINGSKMFTTNGHIADYIFLLARTSPEKPKHQGLTMFLVPTASRRFRSASGMDAVWGAHEHHVLRRRPHRRRVANRRRRWRLAGARAVACRTNTPRGGARTSSGCCTTPSSGHVTQLTRTARHRIADPDVRRRIARVAIEVEVSMLLQRRCVWMSEQGQIPVAEGPMSKVFSTEALVRASQDINEMVGPDALRSYFEPTAPEQGRFEHSLRFSLGTTIYAGTSEVQRTIIAQRGLGLPR